MVWKECQYNFRKGRGNTILERSLGRRTLEEKIWSTILIIDWKSATIADMRNTERDNLEWHFRWRRDLFEWEADMLRYLKGEIGNATFRSGGSDCIVWHADLSNCYLVKSTYSILSEASNFGSQTIYNKVWNKFVPLKFSVFAWQVIQNRIPSKENIVKRGILNTNAHSCEGGCGSIKSTSHLFLECSIVFKVWLDILCWLELSLFHTIILLSILTHFLE